MKFKSISLLTFVFVSFLVCPIFSEPEFEPYKILGVEINAPSDEIRKTYKKLAKLWHPDKNNAPEAHDRFTEIIRAYEILGDEKKKEKYDRFGTVDDSPAQQGNHRGAQFFRTPFGNFQFFQDGFEGDNKNMNRITARFLQNRILPESFEKPYIFFATTDFCFNCVRVQPIWSQFTKDLETLDLGFGVLDVDFEGNVATRLRIPRIPCIGAVVKGRSIIFETEEYSIKTLRVFTRKLFSDDLLTTVKSDTVETFLDGWRDNRVRVIFFGTQGLPTMRLIVALHQVRNNVLASYVDLNADKFSSIVDRFEVETNLETLLIFHEDSVNPVYAESKKQFTTGELLSALKSNKYLKLPRISSLAVFEELCPPTMNYCVMLTFHSSKSSQDEVSLFREFVFEQSSRSDNIKFMYSFTDIQTSLLSALERPDSDFQIVVFSRRQGKEMEYTWVQWCADNCHGLLEAVFTQIRANRFRFNHRSVKRYDIKDELEGGLFARILKRLRDWWDHFTYSYFDGDHTLTLVTILSTTICVAILTFLVSVLNNQSEETTPNNTTQSTPKSPYVAAHHRAASGNSNKFTIYDLRNHNYNNLVRDAVSGHRLLLLFVSTETKDTHVKRFANLMMPFQSTPYILFAFVYIDKYINWYQRVLTQTVGCKDEIRNISPRLCVGTVLAINGFRRCYNIYHPKTLNIPDRRLEDGDGAFVGLDESSDSDTEGVNYNGINGYGMNGHGQRIDGDALLAEGRLLDGLGHWVDRLFDGSLPKCKIDHWPLFPVDEPEEEESLIREEKKDQ